MSYKDYTDSKTVFNDFVSLRDSLRQTKRISKDFVFNENPNKAPKFTRHLNKAFASARSARHQLYHDFLNSSEFMKLMRFNKTGKAASLDIEASWELIFENLTANQLVWPDDRKRCIESDKTALQCFFKCLKDERIFYHVC